MTGEWLVTLFLFAGSLFMLTAAIGLLRLPDIYTRMHAITKAPAMGMFFFAAAAMARFPTWQVAIKVLAILSFIFLITPVASHMMGRAAHLMRIEQYEGTIRDDLQKDRENKTER